MTNGMNVSNKTVLITGANRGIGRALVNEALKPGAKRVYAASRVPAPSRPWSASSQLSCGRAPPVRSDTGMGKSVEGGRYVPGMHRKHSSNGRRSRIYGRSSRGLHRQVQKIFQNKSSQSVSERKRRIRWQ